MQFTTPSRIGPRSRFHIGLVAFVALAICVTTLAAPARSAAAATTNGSAESGAAYNIYTCDAYANTPYMSDPHTLIANISMFCGNNWSWVDLTGRLQRFTNAGWADVAYFDSGHISWVQGTSHYFFKGCPEGGHYFRTQATAHWSTYPVSNSATATSGSFFMYCPLG